MKRISLHGGSIHYSESSSESYRIEKGSVLVYIIPIEKGEDGKRLLLGEFPEESRIPGFAHESELMGLWHMGIVALDSAVITLEDEKADEELILDFASKVGMELYDVEDYEAMLIECYERMRVKERGHIYAVKRDQERGRESTLRLIASVFDKGGLSQEGIPYEVTGKGRYDAIAYICKKKKIHVASLERVQECCGRNPSVDDIARVSHFIVRKITLDPGWHKRDNGPFLSFWKESKMPVACISKGPSRYMFFDPQNNETGKVTAEIAEKISQEAIMFYRPFPEKALTIKDLFFFGISEVYVGDLVRLLGLTLLGTLIGLLLPYLNEQAYDKFIPMGHVSGLTQIGIVMMACMMGNVCFTIVKNIAGFRSMNSMEYSVQAATFDRLFNLPESFFRQFDSATIGQYALGVASIYNIIANTVISSFLSAVFSVVYLIRMNKYSGKMSVWSFLIVFLVSAVIFIAGLRQIKYEKEKRKIDIEVGSRAFQFMNGIAKIRNAWAEDRALQRYFQKFVESTIVNTQKERATIFADTINGAISIITSILFYYLMIRQDIGLTIGEFTGFMAAYGSFSGAILNLVTSFLKVNQVKPMYDDAKIILESLPELSENTRILKDIEGDIELNNVTFSYSPDNEPVLRNLNLHIKKGEYLGIVGSSGCGKSTLLKLLLGFEKPQIGKIYIDRADIDELDKRELRKQFGVVLQDGGLISGSINDNIKITAPGAKISQVERVIRSVGLENDIRQMPMGIHTVVAEGGGSLSGGQKQRILIARAIIGNPKVIFLDEATSALDNVTQSQVVETLEKLHSTKIVIAHRLSTVKNCDRIIVMDKGHIAEEGNYNELMEKRGLFYNLAVRQLSQVEA